MAWIREAGASRYYPPLLAEMLFSKKMYDVQKELLGVSEGLFLFVSQAKGLNGHVNHTMWHKKNIVWIAQHMLRVFKQQGNEFIERYIEKYNEILKEHKNLLGKKKVTFEDIYSIISRSAGFMFLSQPHVIDAIEQEFRDYCDSQGLTDSEISILTQPSTLSSPTRERLQFSKLVVEFIKNGISKKKIKNHFEEFYPCFCSEAVENNLKISEEWLTNKFNDSMQEEGKEYHLKIVWEISQQIEKIKRKKEKIRNRISDHWSTLSMALEVFTHYRLESHLIWMTWLLRFSEMINSVAISKNILPSMIENMTVAEYSSLMSGIPIGLLSRKIDNKPVNLFTIHIDENSNHSVHFEKEAKELLADNDVDLEPPQTTILHGRSGYKGRVVGKVIVLDEREPLDVQMKDMEDGNILVAWQTKPNMLPAIMKAGAIVTNEGGLTSHAAIVSNELKKPSVLMTRWATDILCSGDLVEVDADRGVVKVLEKNNKRISKQVKSSFARKLADVGLNEDVIFGKKAAVLGDLVKEYCVPEGFCLDTKAFRKHIEEFEKDIMKKIASISFECIEDIKATSNLIQKKIMETELSTSIIEEINKHLKGLKSPYAVRSSSNLEDTNEASYAGQYDSFLYVQSYEEVYEAVKKCWASLFSVRGMIYRNHYKQSGAQMAVIIQTMVKSSISGVVFTQNFAEMDEMYLEIVQGNCESLVSGEVTPNWYCIKKKNLSISKKKENFSVSDIILREIANNAMMIEQKYNCPQDIEWSYDQRDVLWILQSRPLVEKGN